MTSFNAREEALEKLRARKRQEPDAEGFVTVARRAKGGSAARREEAEKQLAKQRAKQTGFDDFYRFQGREKRKRRELELRRQFKDDQDRMREIRARRNRLKVSSTAPLVIRWAMLLKYIPARIVKWVSKREQVWPWL